MKKTIALLALLAAFPPLSTDMYLAAIPLLVEAWQEPLAIVNLTLVAFFVTYCALLLVYGPLSDRYGRRRPLLVGLVIYILASLACGAADRVETMIVARVFQGGGAAAASAIAFAICKDLFAGNLRQRIFIQLGIIVACAPMVAPIIGGWIITHLSYRYIFVLQAGLGLLAAIGIRSMEESLTEFSRERLVRVFFSYGRLFGNRPFFILTLAYASLGAPFFAFIAISADIYITDLGYSEQVYGYLFSFNASAFMIAPFLFSRMVRKIRLVRLLSASYVGVLLSSLLLLANPFPQPLRLALPMWLFTFFFAFGRPPGNNLLLEQVDQDVGAASSFMVFVFFMTGSLSMWFISLDWSDKLLILGAMGLVTTTVTLITWFAVKKWLGLRLPEL